MFMQSFLHFLFLRSICTLSNNICSNWHDIVGMTWIAHISCIGEMNAVELWCENFQ